MAFSKVDARSVSGAVSGRKNLVINGAMQVAQRGTSLALVTYPAFVADRFRTQLAGLGAFTLSQSTDAPDGFYYSSKLLCTTADASPAASDLLLAGYYLEGQDLQHLQYGTSNAKQITLSFWVKSNKTGTFACNLFNASSTPYRKNVKSYTVDSADTWEYKTITFEGDTAYALANSTNRVLDVTFWMGAGSNWSGTATPDGWADNAQANQLTNQTDNLADAVNNYWQITGIQLEVGDTATDFEHRSYGEELALCQRYFIRYSNETGTTTSLAFPTFAWSGGSAYGNVFFPATMRAIPTFVQSGTNIFRVYINGGSYVQTGSSLGVAGTSCAEIYTYGTSVSGFTRFEGTTAWCHFDAEL